MTDLPNTTNAKPFRLGDVVMLAEDVRLKGFPGKTIPAGEPGIITDVDPEASNELMVRLVRRFDWLWCWRSMIPITADRVTLRLRRV